ncbi:MAG: acyl-CoA thioesterase [Firmicutes bacterium]|nr:acyl-CoA thioesterase [Bacillota bacterium]MBQ5955875.1 acyl-CoA thioesterase [Bacillota bacterium]
MFTYLRKAHYHETDQMGFIHHSNYVKWMEEARVAFMDEIGLSYRSLEEGGIVSPVTSISVDYKRPVLFDDELEISVSVNKYSGVKLEIGYAMYNKTKDELAAEAVSHHCFMKDGRVVSLKRANPELDVKIKNQMEDEAYG